MWIALLLAVCIHEVGHLLAARCVGVRLDRLRPTATGLRLLPSRGGFPSYRAEATVALGGPLANLLSAPLLALLCPVALAHVSLYLAILNLLPIRSFDGGRALICFLCGRHAWLPDRAERAVAVLSVLVLLLFWTIAVYLLLRQGSALSLYLFCLQLARCVLGEADGNLPCNG